MSENQDPELLPDDQEIQGWVRKEAASNYTRDGLYGHINGGAEIFLQGGFQHLTVCSYARPSGESQEEIFLEIYQMATPLDAFGIFSIKRAAEETTSPRVDALHWVSESQVNLVKDVYFINILGFECEPEHMLAFSIFMAAKISGSSFFPIEFSRFPEQEKIKGSEKYLQGSLAAIGESVLLQSDFWGFAQGARGFSTRYRPHNSRLILLEYASPPDNFETKVIARFREFLDEVKSEKGEVWGANAVGRIFLFRQAGSRVGLSLGEESLETARAKLGYLLE